jgi:hypothetical protein
MDYFPPQWSSSPLNFYSVQLIEDGVVIFDFSVDLKPFYTIGRDADLKVEHESVQSFHAVLQHSDEGFLFIYPFKDCRVRLNKKTLKFCNYAKVFPNDILEFGDFSGILAVSGPAFIKRTEKFFNAQGKVAKSIRESLQRVSWGFAEDAVNEQLKPDDLLLYEDQLDYHAIMRREDLSEKQMKIIQNQEKLNEKIQGLERIIEKSKKNQENYEKIASLQDKLENFKGEKEIGDDNLRASFFPECQSFKVKQKGLYDYSSSEDEFYNRVSEGNMRKSSENKQGELDKLVTERNELTYQITHLSIKDDSEDDDPLENFMQSNNWALKEQNLINLGERLRKINAEIEKICQENPGVSIYACPPDDSEIRLGMKKRKVKEKSEEFNDREKVDHVTAKVDVIDSQNDWTPPEGQTGDGKTSLNKKYGY